MLHVSVGDVPEILLTVHNTLPCLVALSREPKGTHASTRVSSGTVSCLSHWSMTFRQPVDSAWRCPCGLLRRIFGSPSLGESTSYTPELLQTDHAGPVPAFAWRATRRNAFP